MKRLSYLVVSFFCFAASQASEGTKLPVRETIMVPMRDHTRLATDIYLPTTNRPLPVVFIRTPYNKAKSEREAEDISGHQYAVVIQDTRGRFASEGENLPFQSDDRDGADTLTWIAQQGWCDGKIGTYGGSALGITQLQMASAGPRELTCQHITVAAPDLYKDLAYPGGVFRKALVEDWLRLSQFDPKALTLWVGHFGYDQFWQDRDVSRRYALVNVPALHIGGYFDIFAQGTINAFNGFQKEGGPKARNQQKLLMGPWTHGVLTDKAGDLVFPKASRPPNNVQDPFRWWEYYLKGVINGVTEIPAVTYYVMGDVTDPRAPGNGWREANQWPPVATKSVRWFFHSNQTLSPIRPSVGSSVGYIYDPQQPVPTLGGNELTIPAGPRDQRPIEDRPDVVAFTSEKLMQPMEVTGNVSVRLYVLSDAPDTDFLARLCDVYPDGRSFNICEGIIRARYRKSFLEPTRLREGRVYPVDIVLWPTSIIFNRGHQLRLDLTSSSAPAYDPNPNTGEPLRWSDRREVAHNGIRASAPYFSHIDLPVAP